MKPYYQDDNLIVYQGDAYKYAQAIDQPIHCGLTSSDYWQQIDHLIDGQVGMLELDEYIETLVNIFAIQRTKMVEGGCNFQIMNDTTNNHDHAGDMTVTDRPPNVFEWILYHYKHKSNSRPFSRMKKREEPGALPSDILRFAPVRGNKNDHRCPFPPGLAKALILSCTDYGETVCDLFGGSGTTAVAALELGRKCITGDLDKDNCDKIIERCQKVSIQLDDRIIQPHLFHIGT